MDLWRTSMVSYLTCATIIVEDQEIGDNEIGPLFALIVVSSPLLNEFHHDASVLITFDDLDKLGPLPLSSLRMPRARFEPASRSIFRRIAGFWPMLERLDLQETPSSLDDLVSISRYLPELRDLAVIIPGGYSPEVIRAPQLSPTQLDAQRTVWLSHSFLLSPGPLPHYVHKSKVTHLAA